MKLIKGTHINIEDGQLAYIPPRLVELLSNEILQEILSTSLLNLLAEAERALGELNAQWSNLGDPWSLLWLYFRREAVDSSAIEGTRTTMAELLEFEAGLQTKDLDRKEVANYFVALREGIKMLEALPISSRLIRELHKNLLSGKVRGYWRAPGEFKKIQNYIEGKESGIKNAIYIPPPPQFIDDLMSDLERFVNESELPASIIAGIAHAQFEMIHPFMDGNGRIGRLLIILILLAKKSLTLPALYLSKYFLRNREEYYARLKAVSESGDWTNWLAFFLKALAESAKESIKTVNDVEALIKRHESLLVGVSPKYAQKLVKFLLEKPVFTSTQLKNYLGISWPYTARIIQKMEGSNLIRIVKPERKRNRLYAYLRLISMFGS